MVPEDKAALRARLHAALLAMSAEVRAEASATLRAALAPRLVGRVAAYAPMPEEVDLWPLLSVLAAEGRLVLPRIVGPNLTLHPVPDLAALVPNRWGIREPAEGSPIVVAEALDTVVVPGLGFTDEGARLGRGRGYYDRLLPRTRATTVAVAYAVQRCTNLPVEPHDIPVAWVHFA